MRQRVYDKWLILIFKGVFGLHLRRVVLALYSPVLHIQRCFGTALAWGCPCFMQPRSSYSKVFLGCSCVDCPCFVQPRSSYSKVFWGCSRVGLPLLYAALFFIFKGVLGLLLLRVALALCSPVLHIQRCFVRLQRGVRPAFMQFLQRMMMPLVADVQRLSWQTGRHLAMSALPMSAGISRRIMLFLYLPWSGSHFKPGVSCYLLSFLLFRQFLFFNYELKGVFAHSVCSFYLNKQ